MANYYTCITYNLSTSLVSISFTVKTSDRLQQKVLRFIRERCQQCTESKSNYSARSTAQTVDTFFFFKGLAGMSKSVIDPNLLSPSS